MDLLRNKGFDKSKWTQLPRDVVIGHDALTQLPAVCDDLSLGSRVLVVTGSHTLKIAGETVLRLLQEPYSAETFIADTISPAIVRKGEKAAAGSDFLIGVGGGRVIDTAKIVSYNLEKQFISIPTAASHDGIASASATVPSRRQSHSLKAHPPAAIIADTGSSPRRPTGCWPQAVPTSSPTTPRSWTGSWPAVSGENRSRSMPSPSPG